MQVQIIKYSEKDRGERDACITIGTFKNMINKT